MHLVTGELWDELGKAELLLVTTNSTFTRAGDLVMGAGVALQAKTRLPGLPTTLGHQARVRGFVQPDGRFQYFLLPGGRHTSGTWVGAFQTKYNWMAPSPLLLICDSAHYLARVADRFERIALAFPGIGHGGLDAATVLRILTPKLPDNVYVYQRV